MGQTITTAAPVAAPVVAGIDTGKHKLDVALHGRAARLQVDNTDEGHAQLSRWLRRYKVERVGIEASGGYERSVVTRLHRDGFTVVRFQPRQVRAYAEYRLQRAKNDAIDAALIAACTAEVRHPRAPADPRFEALCEHLTLVEQIEEDIARLKTRREATRQPRLRQLVDDEIRRYKALRRTEIQLLVDTLRQHPDLARRLDLTMSVDGVGLRTALAFVIRLPELGTLDREEAAALVGVAPYDDDSGQPQRRQPDEQRQQDCADHPPPVPRPKSGAGVSCPASMMPRRMARVRVK